MKIEFISFARSESGKLHPLLILLKNTQNKGRNICARAR